MNEIKFVNQSDLYTATEEIWTKAKETFSGPSVVLTTGTSTEAVMSLNAVTNHIEDTDIHVTAAEKNAWNAKPDVVYSKVNISANTSNVTAPSSITGATNSGKMADVIYVNNGNADYTVTVSTSAGYVSYSGSLIELTCPVGGYCEVNYLNLDGTIYVRGL